MIPTPINEEVIAITNDGREVYDNAPTVVVVAVTWNRKVLVIRRATDPGRGSYALPGGFHMRGERWQECGAREVLEEVGLVIKPESLKPCWVITDHFGHNCIFAEYRFTQKPEVKVNPEEVLSASWQDWGQISRGGDNWAFPLHERFASHVTYE